MAKCAHLFQFFPDVVRETEAFRTDGLDSHNIAFVATRSSVETLYALVTNGRIFFARQSFIFIIAIIVILSVMASQAPSDIMVRRVSDIGWRRGNNDFASVHLPE